MECNHSLEERTTCADRKKTRFHFNDEAIHIFYALMKNIEFPAIPAIIY